METTLETQNTLDLGVLDCFDPGKIFNCGQCFRFENAGGSAYEGVAFGKYLRVEKDGRGHIVLEGVSREEYRSIFRDFLDIDTDYAAITDILAGEYEVMAQAGRVARGIRILRQDPWETLCSFIISQNNNIPRIKKIINAMCRAYGDKILSPDGREFYSFPSAERLYQAGEGAIFDLRTGFRAKYIFDAARRVALGDIDLDSVYGLDTQSACDYLMTIKGVGLKVASCVLLFAYHKTDSFPVDVWVKRILQKYFDGQMPNFGQYAGIAQQYLFYYERYVVNGIEV